MWRIALVFLICMLPATAGAQRNLIVTGEQRVALVIGNDAYYSVRRLERAGRDARAIGAELKRLGFEVLAHTNLDRRGMNLAIGELVDKVAGGGVGVLFFARHEFAYLSSHGRGCLPWGRRRCHFPVRDQSDG